jgi:hypothetical protein
MLLEALNELYEHKRATDSEQRPADSGKPVVDSERRAANNTAQASSADRLQPL